VNHWVDLLLYVWLGEQAAAARPSARSPMSTPSMAPRIAECGDAAEHAQLLRLSRAEGIRSGCQRHENTPDARRPETLRFKTCFGVAAESRDGNLLIGCWERSYGNLPLPRVPAPKASMEQKGSEDERRREQDHDLRVQAHRDAREQPAENNCEKNGLPQPEHDV
jgi:hypothetical protein